MALRRLRLILLYGCLGALGLVLVLMLAVKLALDRVPHYQAELKEWVHAHIGYRIAFAHVSPAFRWYGPELYFDRFELRSPDDRRVLARAAGGRVGLDLWELIRRGKLLAGRIELDAPDISITRIGPNEFALASEIKLGAGDASPRALRLDDLPTGTLAIRGGAITVEEWNPALPQLELSGVNLDLLRGNGMVVLALAARLPAALGGELSVDARASGLGRLDTVAWDVRARARNLAFGGWRELLPQYLSGLGAGAGGFELAVDGQGAALTRAELNFEATDVIAQLANEPGVKFDEIAGALSVTHAGDRWTLRGRRLRALRAGHRDPESQFDVSWRGTEAGLVGLQARASYLRAETLLPLAGLLPQRDLRERLQDLAPTGEWLDMRLDLTRGSAGEPWRFAAQAHFRDVGFAPLGRAPGLRGLNGMLAGTDSGGRVELRSDSAVFAWPVQLPQPVGLQAFNTTLYWKRTAEDLLIATPAIEIRNSDAMVHGRAAWRQRAGDDSPVLTVVAAVDDGTVADAHLYFPRALIAPPALAWLNRAFVTGHLSHADVVIQGPVRHFPFRDGSGQFLARTRIDGLTLDYREGWPPAAELAVLAEFRNEGLTVQLDKGAVGNLTVTGGDARFADFKTGELTVHASVRGDAAGALDYLRATPLDAMADHAFSDAEAQGPIQSEIDLFLPFREFDQRRILVHTHLHGVELNRRGSTLSATELQGDADLVGAHVAHAEVHGRILGGPFQMTARAPRSGPPTRTQLVFNGSFSGDAIHAALALPAALPVNGSTDWHGVLRIAPEPARERSLRLSGSLAALDLNLPEPLDKPAGRPLPATVEVLWPVTGATLVRVALGSVVRGQALFDPGTNGPQFGRAAVTFGAGAEPVGFSDTQALNAGGRIDRLDLGGWLKLYTPDKGAKPLGSFLKSAKFEVGRLDYVGLSFLDLAVDLASSDAGWHIGIGGPNVVGSIALPGAAESAAPWTMEFKRLKFVEESNLDAPQESRDRRLADRGGGAGAGAAAEGAGTGAGSGAGVGTGLGAGGGAGTSAGAGTGSGTGAGAGERAGSDMGAGAGGGTGSGAGGGAGTSAGAGTGSGTGAGAGERAGSDMGAGTGGGSASGAPDQATGAIDAAEAAPPGADSDREAAQNAPDSGTGAARPGRAATSGAENPRAIPAVNFHAADMIWDERQLGGVRATLVKVEDGIGLDQLLVSGASFTANAKGDWRGKDAGRGHVVGTLSSTDVGATLKQLGYAEVIEAKTGKLDFDMSWLGAPSATALSLATGHVQVALDKGQITGLKPGAGRVMGLASIAALPRRLALDFSDLTDKGFAFDTVRGDFELHDGSAFTDDVLVKGPAAEIGLIGRVGLKNKDYDQTAVVTGNVSSSLPLAAFAAGPVIGGAVLIFTQVFKQPLKGLARGYYRITGSWDNPTVERIKSADAAAATAEAPR